MFGVLALLIFVGSSAAQRRMDCRCTTATNTNVRDAPCGNKVDTVARNTCYRYYGRKQCNGNRRFDHLAEVKADGRLKDVGYIDAAFLWDCSCYFRSCRSVGNANTAANGDTKTRHEFAESLPDAVHSKFYCYLPDESSKLNAFHVVDTSDDLYASNGEFLTFPVHGGLTDEQLDLMFQGADKDGDGKLSTYEFNDAVPTWCDQQ